MDVSLNIRPEVEYTRHARALVRGMAQDAGLPAGAADDLALAAGEAVVNAVKHGTSNGGRVYVGCTVLRDGLEVIVADDGQGFSVEEVVRNTLKSGCDSSAESGRGIPLILALCERCSIEHRKIGTIVTMFKSFAGIETVPRLSELRLTVHHPRAVSVCRSPLAGGLEQCT